MAKNKVAKKPFWKKLGAETKHITEHVGKIFDNSNVSSIIDLIVNAGLAYEGYRLSGRLEGAVVGPLGLKLALANNEAAGIAGVALLTGLGLLSIGDQWGYEKQPIAPNIDVIRNPDGSISCPDGYTLINIGRGYPPYCRLNPSFTPPSNGVYDPFSPFPEPEPEPQPEPQPQPNEPLASYRAFTIWKQFNPVSYIGSYIDPDYQLEEFFREYSLEALYARIDVFWDGQPPQVEPPTQGTEELDGWVYVGYTWHKGYTWRNNQLDLEIHSLLSEEHAKALVLEWIEANESGNI